MAEIERKLQNTIKKLEQWTYENGFKISRNKTVCMHFCQKRKIHPDPQLKLGNDNIKVVKETKFLGLIWDSKLNFIPHIKYLKDKCTKALNLLKVLSNTDWGADRETLLKLYRSLIRSKLDYGCMVYGSARPSYIEQLDPIHNQALRLCLGAFKTSPVESLYVEAQEPPLSYRRDKLALQYALKLKSNPDNPAHDIVFKHRYRHAFLRKPSAIPSFNMRIQRLLREARINTENIAENSVPDHPPWEAEAPDVHIGLANYDKSITSPLFYQSEHARLKDQHPDFSFIYTDGSKQNDRVGYATVMPAGTLSSRLPDEASIFTAETTAIGKALDFIKCSFNSKFIICSDSLSVLQAVKEQNIKNPLIAELLEHLHLLHEKGKSVKLCWIPSHCGITGNEKADKKAKESLQKDTLPISIPYTDLYPQIKLFLFRRWQRHWDEQINNKLHFISPMIDTKPPSSTRRKDQVVLSRVRIGHCRLTHSPLMERKPLPKCMFCNRDVLLTVKHFMLDCEHFDNLRSQHFNVRNMRDLFEHIEPSKILSFLRQSGLYNRI
jgi:ribonuclease HI